MQKTLSICLQLYTIMMMVVAFSKPLLRSVIFILSRKDAKLVGKPQNIPC